MILNLHGQTLIGRVERRSLGDCPRFEHALHLKPEIVVQPRRVMALHDKAVLRLFFELRRRLGRFLKPPFSFVLVERHGGYCSPLVSDTRPRSLCRDSRTRLSKPSAARQLPEPR